MDVVEAIRQRRSVRGYKPEAVPENILREIIETAQRAPSWANTQPWEFAIVRGEKLEAIRGAFVEKIKTAEPTNPDLSAPKGFPEPFDGRRRTVGRKLFEIMGIEREDREKRTWWGLQGLKLFDAPAVIYIFTDQYHAPGSKVWTRDYSGHSGSHVPRCHQGSVGDTRIKADSPRDSRWLPGPAVTSEPVLLGERATGYYHQVVRI